MTEAQRAQSEADRVDAAKVRRVVRGGSWATYARDLRSTNRDADVAGQRRSDSGFRVAMQVLDPAATSVFSEQGADEFGAFADQVIGAVTVRFRWIPGGSFVMGTDHCNDWSCRNEGPAHRVTFAAGFWLGEHEVTRSLYRDVMGEDPSYFADSDPQCPVESVSWLQAQEFCRRCNARLQGIRLALPTESQREYAGRAGTSTLFCTGDAIAPGQANYNHHVGRPVPVKTYAPNAWGIYNAHGNVWEWSCDEYHPTFAGAPDDGSAWVGDGLAPELAQAGEDRPSVLAQVQEFASEDGSTGFSVVLQIGSDRARSVRLGVVDFEQAYRIADIINEGPVRLLD